MAQRSTRKKAAAPPKEEQLPQTTATEDAQAATPEPENVEQTIKDEQAQRDEELKGSYDGEAAQAAQGIQPAEGGTPAGARAGVHARADTQGGFMDQMSARSVNDALEGHFVLIDLNHDGVKDAYKAVRGLEDHRGDYGVYIEPALRDPETGIPVTATVRLRDETNALVTVPYEALRRAEARGR